MLGSKAPRQRRGRNALIGVNGSRLAESGTIGPWADRLYAVDPAGVDTSTPSQISSGDADAAVDGDPDLGRLPRLPQQS